MFTKVEEKYIYIYSICREKIEGFQHEFYNRTIRVTNIYLANLAYSSAKVAALTGDLICKNLTAFLVYDVKLVYFCTIAIEKVI